MCSLTRQEQDANWQRNFNRCASMHEDIGDNYVWLQALGHGPVINIWFQEPLDGPIRLYDRHWWEVHCKAIKHGKDLVEDHINAFINPETRSIRLFFLFKDGTLTEPTPIFYQLENDYING